MGIGTSSEPVGTLGRTVGLFKGPCWPRQDTNPYYPFSTRLVFETDSYTTIYIHNSSTVHTSTLKKEVACISKRQQDRRHSHGITKERDYH
jgi:hypothetical protein